MSDGLPDIVRKRHRLAVRFMVVDGKMDAIAQIEPRRGNAANRFALSIFSDELQSELDRRGYDLATMRFQIDRKKSVIEEWEKQE